MEFVVIFLLYGGGFLAALVLMVIATTQWAHLWRLSLFSFLALGCLFAQRSCWNIAGEIGRATGGGGGTEGWGAIGCLSPPETAIMACIAWMLLLILLPKRKIRQDYRDDGKRKEIEY